MKGTFADTTSLRSQMMSRSGDAMRIVMMSEDIHLDSPNRNRLSLLGCLNFTLITRQYARAEGSLVTLVWVSVSKQAHFSSVSSFSRS